MVIYDYLEVCLMLLSNGRKYAVLLVLLALFAVPLSVCGAEEQRELPTQLTPALDWIAKDFSVIMTGIKGSDIQFSPDDFEQCLGVRKIDEIMLTSLPPVTSGTLKLGDSTVLKNQVIARSRLDELRFCPENADEAEASFTFRAIGSEEYELTCSLYLLDQINYRPSVEMVASEKSEITTYENIATFRRMSAIDPENDLLRFEIVEYPKKGLLTVTNRTLGAYVYTPISGFVGKDSFSYAAYDTYGNRSDVISVKLNVIENEAAVVYSDLIGQQAQYPALRLTADGITSVRYEDGCAVFAPNETVSRLDFLLMAMQSAGYRISTTAESTVFADDAQIPSHAKGYVAAAVNMGFITGVETENGLYFYPNASITRAEAAVILGRMVDVEQPAVRPVFSDSDNIPSYAIEAVHALNHVGILECIGDAIEPEAEINRGQCAQILCGLMDHLVQKQAE